MKLPLLAATVLTAATVSVVVAVASTSSIHVESLKAISQTPKLPHTRACLEPGDGAPSSDVEPILAVNPRNAGNLIAAWWTGQAGFKRRAVAGGYAVTHDGGRSWSVGVPKHVDTCTGRREYNQAGAHDPWATFAPDGRRAYLLFESGRPVGRHVPPGGTTNRWGNVLWIFASSDGGRSWGRPVKIAGPSRKAGLPDQPRLAVDPTDPHRLYVVWRQLPPSALKTGDVSNSPGYFSRSNDGGRSWSKPRQFVPARPDSGIPQGPFMHHPFALADGTLVDVYDDQNFFDFVGAEQPAVVSAVRSRDDGRHWSKPVAIAKHSPLPFFKDPRDSQTVAIGIAASSAIGPRGTLYATWGDRTGKRRLLRILFSKSRDGGRHWSRPRQVGHTSTGIIGPTIAVAGDGDLGVTYYDSRHDRAGDKSWTTDVFFAHSRDGGATWKEDHLAGPFDLATGPHEEAHPGAFIETGDYFGLVGLPHGFAAAFTMAQPKSVHGRADIFFARIRARP